MQLMICPIMNIYHVILRCTLKLIAPCVYALWPLALGLQTCNNNKCLKLELLAWNPLRRST